LKEVDEAKLSSTASVSNQSEQEGRCEDSSGHFQNLELEPGSRKGY